MTWILNYQTASKVCGYKNHLKKLVAFLLGQFRLGVCFGSSKQLKIYLVQVPLEMELIGVEVGDLGAGVPAHVEGFGEGEGRHVSMRHLDLVHFFAVDEEFAGTGQKPLIATNGCPFYGTIPDRSIPPGGGFLGNGE